MNRLWFTVFWFTTPLRGGLYVNQNALQVQTKCKANVNVNQIDRGKEICVRALATMPIFEIRTVGEGGRKKARYYAGGTRKDRKGQEIYLHVIINHKYTNSRHENTA